MSSSTNQRTVANAGGGGGGGAGAVAGGVGGSGVGANDQPTSVFDSYNRSIRGNIVRGATSLMNTWSDCDYILRYNRICVYIVTVVLVFTLFALLLKWSNTLVMVLLAIVTFISIYNSLLISKPSCFNILGTS